MPAEIDFPIKLCHKAGVQGPDCSACFTEKADRNNNSEPSCKRGEENTMHSLTIKE